jgi:hypothetical protein
MIGKCCIIRRRWAQVSRPPIDAKHRKTKNQRINDRENGGILPDAARPATELPAHETAANIRNRIANQYGIAACDLAGLVSFLWSSGK